MAAVRASIGLGAGGVAEAPATVEPNSDDPGTAAVVVDPGNSAGTTDRRILGTPAITNARLSASATNR